MEDLEQKEIDLIISSLQVNAEHIAGVIRDRNLWKWEEIKDSKLWSFEKEEDFKQYVEDLNKSDLRTIEDIENLQEKLYNF